MSKVVALGGKHKSVSSLLSQAIADPTITNAVIVTFHENGESEVAHFEFTRQQLAYGAFAIGDMVFR